MVERLKLNVRVSQLHRDWLAVLCDVWGMNEGGLVALLIDRAYHEYARQQGINVYSTAPALHPQNTEEGQ